jgi:TolA-binding protein
VTQCLCGAMAGPHESTFKQRDDIEADLRSTTTTIVAKLREGWNGPDMLNLAADRLAELEAEVDKRILDRAELWRRADEQRDEIASLRGTIDRLRALLHESLAQQSKTVEYVAQLECRLTDLSSG